MFKKTLFVALLSSVAFVGAALALDCKKACTKASCQDLKKYHECKKECGDSLPAHCKASGEKALEADKSATAGREALENKLDEEAAN